MNDLDIRIDRFRKESEYNKTKIHTWAIIIALLIIGFGSIALILEIENKI